MQKSLQDCRTATPLDDLGAIRVRGPDAVKFLQGQLSNDVAKLSAERRSLLAGYHNPQGRVIALLRLVWLGAEDILMILPRELAPAVVAKLAKFVLRAKVKLEDESADWRVAGLIAPASPSLGAIVFPVDTSQRRWWTIAPVDKPVDLSDFEPLDRNAWRALDVAAGLPQVYAGTSEAFVAQMLNLDALDAIAFDKGCYTGQEVIARAHYRGKVKRRMQRFRSSTTSSLRAGDSVQLADGQTGKVVEVALLPDGGCEFLAVAPMSPLAVEALSLPYSIGEQ
jgi:folate-binding protein YgfZ